MDFPRPTQASNPQEKNSQSALKSNPPTLRELQENWQRIQRKLAEIEARITRLEEA